MRNKILNKSNRIPRRQRFSRLRLNNLRLRYQLIILFLLVSLLPSIGLGFLVNWTVSHLLERQAIDHTLQLIGKVNQTLDSDMENLQNMTYLIGFDRKIQDFMEGRTGKVGGTGGGTTYGMASPTAAGTAVYDKAPDDDILYELKQYLQGYTTLYPEIAGVLIVNSMGDYISNELYARTPASLTGENWYRTAVANEGLFTILGRPSGRNLTSHVHYRDDEVVTVVRSIVEPDTRQVMGVILIDLKLWTISKAARDVKLGKTGYLTVLDRQGREIYTPDNPYTHSIPASWFGSADSGAVTQEVDGRSLQLIYGTSSFTGWRTVGVFLTRESVFEIRQIHFYVICFLFLVCLFGLTASLRLSRSISSPISQLMSLMKRAESGDLEARYREKRGDEVGMLGSSFNRMLIQIRRLMQLNERKERQKREAELRSLQANIKPHFLYNTLDTIHWMAKKKGADEVSEMVESLSKLFRIGLSKGEDMIPLADEIEHIESYLLIQKTRYQGRLTVHLEVAPEVRYFLVLKLLLQPIVENAIYHGIKARRGPGTIRISVLPQSGELVFTIEDDGAGMSPGRLQGLREKLKHPLEAIEHQSAEIGRSGKSYGMLNVQARLQLAFGARYGIEVESGEGEGTRVSIHHPLLQEPAASQAYKEDQE
ncbi:Sensor histidine kinase YehU [compost metagenome]